MKLRQGRFPPVLSIITTDLKLASIFLNVDRKIYPYIFVFLLHHFSAYLCHHHLICIQLLAFPFSQGSLKLFNESLCLPSWKI